MVRVQRYTKRNGTDVSSHNRQDREYERPAFSAEDIDEETLARIREKKKEARPDHYDAAIIHFLGHRGESNANEIADGARMSWFTATQHLKWLEENEYIVRTLKRDRRAYKLAYLT